MNESVPCFRRAGVNWTRGLTGTHIVDSTSETRQQAQHRKADTEGRPEAELALELRLIPKSDEHLFIGGQLAIAVGGDLIAAKDGGDRLLRDGLLAVGHL